MGASTVSVCQCTMGICECTVGIRECTVGICECAVGVCQCTVCSGRVTVYSGRVPARSVTLAPPAEARSMCSALGCRRLARVLGRCPQSRGARAGEHGDGGAAAH